jgi:hypothetical protein
MDQIPVTGNPKLDHWLAILGIAMSVSSAAATFLNSKIRAAIDSEGEVPTLFLWLGIAVNAVAFNLDKCAQFQKMLRGHSVKVLTISAASGDSAQPPADPPKVG